MRSKDLAAAFQEIESDVSVSADAKRAPIDQLGLRVLRLLSLYRCVVAASLIAYVPFGHGHYDVVAAAVIYAVWAFASVFVFNRLRTSVQNVLLVQLAVDLGMLVFVLSYTDLRITAFAPYLFPIAAAHGWFLRDRFALAHAAFATIALIGAEWSLRSLSAAEFTQAGAIGAGYFLMTAFGMVLGRSVKDTEQLAHKRQADLQQFAQLNEMVISELNDGVLAVDTNGQIIMWNPRARRWLTGDEAAMTGKTRLSDVAPTLAARWKNFVTSQANVDTSPLSMTMGFRGREGETGTGVRKTLNPRFMPIDVRRDRGTIIFLEDVDQAQAEAQQLKLAALGRLSASIAHEIRNPLSAIKQAAQLLGEEVGPGSQAYSLSKMIDKNTERIDRIVRDVSMLGQRDRGSPEILSLPTMAKECIEELIPHINAHGGFFLAATADIKTSIDRSHLEEIFTNLLSNAWRHSKKSKGSVRITIGANAEMQRAVIAVVDDGDGVPKHMVDKIFEPFFSGSGSTGLGLYLVRELAQAAGGTVRLGQSTTGARFVIELPLVV